MSVKLRFKELQNKGKSYYLDIWHNGARNYEFLDIKVTKQDTSDKAKEKKTLAELIRSQREIELSSLGIDYIPKHKKKVDLIAYYQNYLDTYKKKDVRMIKYSFNKFKDYLISVGLITEKSNFLKAAELKEVHCEEFLHYLKNDAGLSGETPNNYFARFKKVINRAAKDGLFYNNPVSGVVNKKDGAANSLKKQILSKEEIQLLRETPCGNEEVKRAFLFACHTGLGVAEIRNIRGVNVDNGRLIINREKTGSEINLKLSDFALEMIDKSKESSENLFDIKQSNNAINKCLKNWIKKAELDKHITFYCARHTFAVLLLSNKANLKTVSDALAHTTPKHTIKYLNYVQDVQDKATSSL